MYQLIRYKEPIPHLFPIFLSAVRCTISWMDSPRICAGLDGNKSNSYVCPGRAMGSNGVPQGPD